MTKILRLVPCATWLIFQRVHRINGPDLKFISWWSEIVKSVWIASESVPWLYNDIWWNRSVKDLLQLRRVCETSSEDWRLQIAARLTSFPQPFAKRCHFDLFPSCYCQRFIENPALVGSLWVPLVTLTVFILISADALIRLHKIRRSRRTSPAYFPNHIVHKVRKRVVTSTILWKWLFRTSRTIWMSNVDL